MSQATTCRSCGADLSGSASAPRFCPHCGAEHPLGKAPIVNPAGPAPTIQPAAPPKSAAKPVAPKVNPVVQPAAPPVVKPAAAPAPSAPVIQPAQSSKPRTVAPAAAPTVRPTVEPAPAAASAAPPRVAPPQRKPAAAARRPAASAAPRRTTPSRQGLSPTVLAAIGGGVLVLIVIVVMASSGDAPRVVAEGDGGGGANAERASDEPFDWDRETARIVEDTLGRETEPTTAEAAWADARKLRRKADEFSMTPDFQRRLNAIAKKREALVLKIDPDFAPWHEAKGNRHYDGRFGEWATATWLTPRLRERARVLHVSLEKATRNGDGWGPKKEFEQYDVLLEEVGGLPEVVAELRKDAWGMEVLDQLDKALVRIGERFALQKQWGMKSNVRFRGLTVVVQRPFAFLLEVSPGWKPEDEARALAERLGKPFEDLLSRYGSLAEVESIGGPIPVLAFKSQRNFLDYTAQTGMPEMFRSFLTFEDETGCLVLEPQGAGNAIDEEAANMALRALMNSGKQRRVSTAEENGWFLAGLLATHQTGGGVDAPRVRGLAMSTLTKNMRARLQTLPEMLDAKDAHVRSFRSFPLFGGSGVLSDLNMSGDGQAWLFMHFMRHFNVDDEGYVDPTRPGVYAERWDRYLKHQLTRGGGGKQKFVEVMGLTEGDLPRLAEEASRWLTYLSKKVREEEIDEQGNLVKAEGDDRKHDKLPAFIPNRGVFPDPSEDRSIDLSGLEIEEEEEEVEPDEEKKKDKDGE